MSDGQRNDRITDPDDVHSASSAALLIYLVDLLEVGEVIGSELSDDAGQQLLELLRLRGTAHNVGVRGDGGLNLQTREEQRERGESERRRPRDCPSAVRSRIQPALQ